MQEGRSDLRARLVTAALEQLDAGEEFSLRSVARRAGVSAMAPYRHFADKDALLLAVAERGFERLHARLAAADWHDDPGAALVGQGEAYIGFALAHPTLFRLMFVDTPKGALPGGDSAYGVLAARVLDVVPDASEAGTLTCWAAVHGMAMLALDQRLNTPIDARVTAALELLVEGLLARRPLPAG